MTNLIGSASLASGSAGATVTHQTMAITSDFTTDSESFIDTTILLTMPTSDQMAFVGATTSFKSSESNTGYFRIEDASTGQVAQRYSMITGNRVITLNYACDCDGQTITLQCYPDGGDSTITLEGLAGSTSQGTMNSLEVG